MSTAGSESAIFDVPNSMVSNIGVDYFKHEFEFEEIHSCWRRVYLEEIDPLTKKRLLNLCWRKFFQNKDSIPKLDPLIINWKKKNETNWLYGPLFCSQYKDLAGRFSLSSLSSQNFTSSQQDAPKSILKKRTKTQSFLQYILSTGSGYFLSRARRRARKTSIGVDLYLTKLSPPPAKVSNTALPILMQTHMEYPQLQKGLLQFSRQVDISSRASPCTLSPSRSDQELSELYSDYDLINEINTCINECRELSPQGVIRDDNSSVFANIEGCIKSEDIELEDGSQFASSIDHHGEIGDDVISTDSQARTPSLRKCLQSLNNPLHCTDKSKRISFQSRLALLLDSVFEELGVGFRLLEIEQNPPTFN